MLLAEKERFDQNQSELHEAAIRDLQQELEASKTEIKALKDKISEPPSMLMQLQKELLDAKVRYHTFH